MLANEEPIFSLLKTVMQRKPTYEELERRIRDLESYQADTGRLEKAYLEQERLLEIIINELPFWFSLKDREGKYLLVNKNLAEAHGLQASAIINRTTLETPELYPDGLKKMVERDNRVLKTGERIEVPEYQVEIDDEVRWRRLVKTPWSNDKGEILGIVSWSEDITESKRVREELRKYRDHLEDLVEKRTDELQREITSRKQIEAALKKSENRLKEVIELSDAGYFFIDLDGCFQKVNRAWLRLHKYEITDDIIGKHFSLTQPEEHIHEAQEIVEQLIAGNKIRTGEFSRLCKDGSTEYHSFTARPVEKNGEIIGIEGFIIDITENKRLEKQIQRSKKMEAIGTLAGGIAHEFNNLLGIIIGNAELAVDDIPVWSSAYNCIEEILGASLRAKDAIQKLLSISLQESFSKKPVQISTIIKETTDLIKKAIPTTIDFQCDIKCTTEMILANQSEINQIIINLCNNSTHAMRNKPGILQVNLEAIALDQKNSIRYENLQPGTYARLTIKDTGEGIEPQVIERVLDPYFTTKDINEGLGMGLAVVSGIVNKHGGIITIESTISRGTSVEVLLPLLPPQSTGEEEKEPTCLPTGIERILLVDDEISLITMTQRMLERYGYEVFAKTSSLEALNLVKDDPGRFDLVITDMAMPDMAGDNLAIEINRIRPDMSIILCTGYSEYLDDNSAQKLPIDTLVYKPIIQEEFLKTVRNVLDTTKGKTKAPKC